MKIIVKIIGDIIRKIFWLYIIAACLSFLSGSAFVLYYLHHDPSVIQSALDIIGK